MKLTKEQKDSAAWKALRAHIEARIAKHQKSNSKSIPIDQTEKLRGRIAELEYLLSMEEEKVQILQD